MNTHEQSRSCRACGQSRPLTDYRRRRTRDRGWAVTCNDCCALRPQRRPRGAVAGRATRPELRARAFDHELAQLLATLYGRPRAVVEALLELLRGAGL